ncbi:MAG TPA: DinB family protein [Dehalococcoidia bacterium]|nr:DinB family protein [Dehalococcoidia bacterium]
MKSRVAIAKRPDGSADAWVADLPGCRAVAGSLPAVLELLPVVVGDHLAWLAGHGEAVDPAAPMDYEVVEETEARGEYVFDFDREALSRDELETAIRHAGFAHSDLMVVLKGLPDVVLDWVPPASSVKIDQIFPDVRSIRMMLEHLTTAEANYFVASLAEERGEPVSVALGDLHASSSARLRALDDGALSRVFTSMGRRGEMHWSARKVMRRMIIHLRFHTREIEQRRSWLTLGVPEMLPENRE